VANPAAVVGGEDDGLGEGLALPATGEGQADPGRAKNRTAGRALRLGDVVALAPFCDRELPRLRKRIGLGIKTHLLGNQTFGVLPSLPALCASAIARLLQPDNMPAQTGYRARGFQPDRPG
jgi:hypothetical protein